jgi:hypothetical protein
LVIVYKGKDHISVVIEIMQKCLPTYALGDVDRFVSPLRERELNGDFLDQHDEFYGIRASVKLLSIFARNESELHTEVETEIGEKDEYSANDEHDRDNHGHDELCSALFFSVVKRH